MISEAKQPILEESDSTRVSFLSWPFIKHRFFSELVVVFLVFDAFFGHSFSLSSPKSFVGDPRSLDSRFRGNDRLNDHLGSPVVITDSSGNDTRFIEYFPYGTIKTETDGSVPNPALALRHKFNSKELDDITGLYDYGARQYDAQLARFITPDPLEWRDASLRSIDGRGLQQFLTNPQNLNRYSYTLNNPLKYLDLTGQKVELAEKSVNGIGRHRFLILTPDNPSDFRDNPRFTTPQGRTNAVTVSGQPLNENCNPICGNLTSKPNTDLNSEVLAKVTIQSPQEDLSDTDFINLILGAESLYENDLEYQIFPNKVFGGYNSNSFARGILKAVGVPNPVLKSSGSAPGFNKPIPLPSARSIPPVLVSGNSQNQSSRSGSVFKSDDGRGILV